MIQSEPNTSSITISRPNASAIRLLTLSGPDVMCRKKTRCTPICATASTESAIGMLGCPDQRAARDVERDHGQPGVARTKPSR